MINQFLPQLNLPKTLIMSFKILVLGFLLLELSACKEIPGQARNVAKDINSKAEEVIGEINKQADQVKKDLDGTSEAIATAVSEKVEEILSGSEDTMPAKEIKKLQQFEYKVFELPVNSSDAEFENELNTLGEDRWECFDIKPVRGASEDDTGGFLFFCKRKPFTPLRFVPKTLLSH